jgi:hypothetical protein
MAQTMGFLVAVHGVDGVDSFWQVMDVNHVIVIFAFYYVSGQAFNHYEVGVKSGVFLG